VDPVDNYICPLEWRYGSKEMRALFSLSSIVRSYTSVEVAIVAGLARAGLAPKDCVDSIAKCAEELKPWEVYAGEEVLGHDIASLAYILGEKCGECGRYVHLGATSYDVIDTAWALILREGIDIVKGRLRRILSALEELAIRYRDTIMVGRTHGQHALPITLGFKLANYIYELARSYERLCLLENRLIRSKISGAVGTMAAWGDKGFEVERGASEYLGLEPHAISTQIAPRDGFAELVAILAILASQLDRFALEVRELSRTEIAEIYEASERVGSSTMPHKRNPVISERISGLAKVMRGLVTTALENIPLAHERDLTNSSSERILIPHAMLVIDQMLLDMETLLEILHIDPKKMRSNIELTRGAIMTESIMIRLVEKGVPRHVAHRMLIDIVRRSGDNDIKNAIMDSKDISSLLSREEIERAMDPEKYLGSYRKLIERAIEHMRNTVEKC
jgi:adenylosuccinate lyase